MTVSKKIWPGQLKALQVLYTVLAQREGWSADDRAQRLEWASQKIGRKLGTFCDLTKGKAGQLIDLIKCVLGQKVRPPRLSRDAAMARGSHGRRGRKPKVETLVTPEALEEVDRLRERVGMTREGFENWLKSRHSPLCGRADAKLLTVGDANRVRWALANMLRRAARDASVATVEEVSAVAQQAR